MTPKDKAKYLLWKYLPTLKGWQTEDSSIAKQCALIAVEELINMAKIYDNHNVNTDKHIYTFECVLYWEEVKQEVENL